MNKRAKTKIIIGIFLFMIILSSFLILNAEEPNTLTKVYNSSNQEVIIKNGSVEVGKIQLLTPIDFQTTPSDYGMGAKMKFTNFESRDDIFKTMEFFNVKSGYTAFNRTFDFLVLENKSVSIIDYGPINNSLGKYSKTNESYGFSNQTNTTGYFINYYSSSNILLCQQDKNTSELLTCDYILADKSVVIEQIGIVGFHSEIQEVWSRFDKLKNKTMIESGEYTVGIFTEILPNEKVEWIPTFYGLRIDEWATWSGNISVSIRNYNPLNSSGIDVVAGKLNFTTSTATLSDGKINNSYFFDGGDYMQSYNTSRYNIFMGDVTWSAWVKIYTTTDEKTILGKANTDQGHVGIRWSINGDHPYVYYDAVGASAIDCTDGTIQNNTWTYIVVTRTKTTDYWKIYVNGTLVCNYDGSHDGNDMGVTAHANTQDTYPVGLGAYWEYDNSKVRPFVGYIDELGLWDRTFTDTEVSFLYNSGNGCSYENENCYTPANTAPTITTTNPTANQNLTSQSVVFSILPKDGEDLTGLWTAIYLNISGGWSINGTNTSAFNNTQTNITAVLPDGTYLWAGWVNDSAGSSAFSSNGTFRIDSTPPQITSPANASINYLQAVNVDFDATDSGAGVSTWAVNDTTRFQINSTGGLTNKTILSGGTWLVNVSVNDTLGNMNYSMWQVVVNKISPTLSLTFDPPSSVVYPTITNTQASGCPTELTCNFYINSSILVGIQHQLSLGVGTWNYTYNTSGNINYTALQIYGIVNVTQNASDFYIFSNTTSPIVYPNAFFIYSNSSSDFTLYRNGSSIINASTQGLASGTYNFTIIRTDQQNYSNIINTTTMQINKATLTGSLNSSSGLWITQYFSSTNISYYENNLGDDDVNYTIYNNSYYVLNNTKFNESVGVYILVLNSSGGSNYSSNNNISTQVLTFSDTIAPSVIFNNQTPTDLNVTNFLGPSGLNITYTVSDYSSLNKASIRLYYKSNSTQDDIEYYQNGTLYSGYFTSADYINNSGVYIYNLLDNQVLPGTYNYGEISLENIIHTYSYLSSPTQYLSIQLLNVSANKKYGFFEIMVNKTSGSGGLQFYYCNSTYNYNSNPAGNSNCYNFYTLTSNTYHHNHSSYSSHVVIPFPNSSTVTISNTSTFLIRPLGNSNWSFYHISNLSGRTNIFRTTTNSGSAWTDRSGTYTVDAHLHQFGSDESFYYYLCANDTYGNQNCSTNRQDLFELAGLSPSSPDVYSPILSGIYTGNMNINYTAAVSPNSYAINYYNITLLNSDYTLNSIIIGNNSNNLGYVWNASTVSDGNYIISVQANDSANQTSVGYSELFTIDSTKPILTIISPTEGQTFTSENVLFNVTLNENGSCNYSLNSGTNTSMSSSDNRIWITWLDINSAGSYNIRYYCNDTAGNIAGSGLYNFTYISTSVSTTPGGGTVYYSSEDATTLDSIEIVVDDNIFYNKPFTVLVKAYNKNKTIIRADSVDINLSVNSKYVMSDLMINEDDIYSKRFIFNDTSIERFYIKAYVKENQKVLTDTVEVYITNMNSIEVAKNKITGLTISATTFLADNWLPIMIFIIFVSVIAFIFSVISFLKK